MPLERSAPGPVERFRPPVVTAHEVVRLRLLDRLTTPFNDADAARITLVRGPAGFGKTTLLAQAYRQVVARGQKAVWLDCSELDADPGHFLDSLYAAAMSIGMDGSDLEFTIADFAKRLARIDTTVYLFLDEFERLAATPVEEMIERLTAALPGGAHLIIASRQAPRTWFLKRELRGLATTIEALDLRLTGTELQTLLSERFNAEEVEQIEHLTEGWPMAVQLARLRSRDTIALRELLGTLERGGLGLFEYLAERVVESLSEVQQRFLRDTSILAFVNPLAANALMERDDGYALLSSVMHLQPIVTVTGDSELTIRLHPLFRQFMRDQLAKSGQQRERELQQRAARFFAARGRTSEAVQHALEASDNTLAAELLKRAGGEELIFTIGPRKVEAILATLPPGTVELSIRLRLMELLMVAVDGRTTVVEVLAERFLTALDADLASATPTVPSLQWAHYARGVVALVRAFLQDLYAGCSPGSVAQALEMDWYCRRHFATEECHLGIVLAFEILLFARCGNVADARRCLADYHALCERNRFAPNLPSINPQRGMLEFLGGDLDKAQLLFERCAELRLDHFAEPEVLLAQLSKALLGMVLYERGRLDEALLLIEGLRTDLDASLSEIVALSYRTRVLSAERLRGRDIADALLDEAFLQARKRDAGRLLIYLRAMRVELLHRRDPQRLDPDELDAIRTFLDEELARPDPSWLFLDQCSRAVIPPLIDLRRDKEAASLAQRTRDVARALGRRHLEATSLILLARAQAQGDRTVAIESLRAALAFTSEAGTVQPYVDLAPQLGQLMVAALAGRTAPSIADHVRTVLRVLDADPAAESDAWRSLSERERDILLVLAAHASTKAAARALGLAPETVKHHLKRIYGKLGVHTREEALAQIARLSG
ncbi:MAG TPA: LuxR C-terminal-related transcriptional regulator [Steroidobacteraceae bacterium]|nr:LuxR C-terminal-related transcriptional regulator [Steroidobacteraceae bacterium]